MQVTILEYLERRQTLHQIPSPRNIVRKGCFSNLTLFLVLTFQKIYQYPIQHDATFETSELLNSRINLFKTLWNGQGFILKQIFRHEKFSDKDPLNKQKQFAQKTSINKTVTIPP